MPEDGRRRTYARLRDRKQQRERVEAAVRAGDRPATPSTRSAARLRAAGLGFNEVLPLERVLDAPQARQPGKLREVEFRGLQLRGAGISRASARSQPDLPPPEIGEHTLELLAVARLWRCRGGRAARARARPRPTDRAISPGRRCGRRRDDPVPHQGRAGRRLPARGHHRRPLPARRAAQAAGNRAPCSTPASPRCARRSSCSKPKATSPAIRYRGRDRRAVRHRGLDRDAELADPARNPAGARRGGTGERRRHRRTARACRRIRAVPSTPATTRRRGRPTTASTTACSRSRRCRRRCISCRSCGRAIRST